MTTAGAIALVAFMLLAIGLTVGGLWLKNIVVQVLSAGGWSLLGFYAFGLSSSPSPTQITDVYMGLFWLSIVMIVASMFLAVFNRPRKEDLAEEVGLDDTDEIEKDFKEISRETRVPRIGRPRVRRHKWLI